MPLSLCKAGKKIPNNTEALPHTDRYDISEKFKLLSNK